MPAACSPQEVVDFANTFLSKADLLATKAVCRTNDAKPFEVIDVFAM